MITSITSCLSHFQKRLFKVIIFSKLWLLFNSIPNTRWLFFDCLLISYVFDCLLMFCKYSKNYIFTISCQPKEYFLAFTSARKYHPAIFRFKIQDLNFIRRRFIFLTRKNFQNLSDWGQVLWCFQLVEWNKWLHFLFLT